jgi:hypothetical protein
VRVFPDHIELEFSEYVDRRSLQDAVFLSPPVGDLTFEWSGREVSITFGEELRRGITYVVTAGTDIVDLRAGNRMASGFTLAFSTGDSIDRGSVAGRVVDDRPEGVMILAYALRNVRPDTLDPSRLRPDYVTQTGTDGRFTLSNLAFGPYRVFAIQDEYRDLLYAPEVDRYGVAPSDLELSPATPVHTDLLFRLTKADTTRPFLTAATPLDRHALEVRLSEPVDSVEFSGSSMTVVDTLSGISTVPEVLWLDRKDRTRAGLVFRDPFEPGRTFSVAAQGIRDDAGNSLGKEGTKLLFVTPETPDTMAPSVTFDGVRDSAQGVMRDAGLTLALSEPVQHTSFVNGVSLRDSSQRPVPFRVFWWNNRDAVIRPVHEYLPAAWYTLSVRMDSVSDLHGNRGADSTAVFHFRTIDLRTTGGVEGLVTAAPAVPLEGRVIITARRLEPADRLSAKTFTDGAHPFALKGLPEGRYTFDAFLDADTTGAYRAGTPFPYVPAARFAVSPDTVRVRARWTVGDVRIPFR